MSTNLYQAHKQWANRPADERFPDLESLYNFTNSKRSKSKEQLRYLRDAKIGHTLDGALILNGNSEPAYFTNWGFGQLCTMIGAPASYLRTLSPDITKNCIQYGLSKSNQLSKILLRENDNNGQNNNLVSAFTSPSYGRIWDADVIERLMDAVEGSSWHTPEAKSNNNSENSGLYASDRDVFAFMINNENPVEVGNAKLGRGFFCWNSETGASTFGLTTFLYNYVCGNHIVWGAEQVQELKIIHKSQALDRFRTYAIPALNRFVENRSLSDKIKYIAVWAMNRKIGETKEQVLEWFKNKPFTRTEVSKAWDTGIAEGEDVTNVWGMVQGLTAYARDMPYADKMVNLERRAGKLLDSVQ